MADKEKELRKMNRTELIEIIYALQQNEKGLRKENQELKEKLEEKTIRLSEAGSIAEAALSLNRIFEDAQAAAEQYIHSVKEMYENKENEEK
ncbi:MAG: DNA repair protein [Clostridiales bacterium]|nr:DNA repair protein [Clostridiales bacterium]